MNYHSHGDHLIQCNLYRKQFATDMIRFSFDSYRLADRVRCEGWTEELQTKGRILRETYRYLYNWELSAYTEYVDGLYNMGVLHHTLRSYYFLEKEYPILQQGMAILEQVPG